ncbi:AIR carboxylase family protein [archaeon]|nr:AIR carboxylase family protein [archaeon]
MTDVFVVFGSASDKAVYESLLEKFKGAGITYEFKVLSAHKTPRDLKSELIHTNAGIFVAGAGLSAALPGVIASEQVKPVVGLPCDGAFQGIDAFLATTQMPPDIPVIGVGVGNTSAAVKVCSNFLHGINQIILIKN